MTFSNEIQQLKEDIALLQMKLQKLEEKSPVEEAFKKVFNHYPNEKDFREGIWFGFEKGYKAHQSLVDDANKIKAAASMINCIIEGNPPNGCSTWNEWFELFGSKGILHHLRISAKEYQPKEKEQKWDVVRESVKWCKEHPDESVEDYLKPHTPEKTEQLLREAFQKVQQTEEWKETQRKIDSNYEEKVEEEPKPMNEVLDRLENKYKDAEENAASYMTNEQLTSIIEAVKTLSKETDTDSYEIVNELIGFCWDEEVAFNIKGGLV